MFQPFCFNHIITDLSFIYIYIYILQSGINEISSNRAQVDENASMRAVAINFSSTRKRAPV